MNNKLKMNNISKFIGLCAASAAILSGCAKQEATKTNSTEKLYFDSWIHVWNSEHQTKAVEHGNGIYILEDEPGTGAEWNPSAHTFAYLDVTVSDLDGNISSTTSEKVAKKIGTYKETYYYGPKINTITEGGCYVGLEDALKGMKMGGRRKVAIPSWLLTGTRYDNKEEYLKHSVDASNAIYDIKLVDMMADVYKWETDSMEVFVAKYMDGVDSTYFAGDSTALKYGFYFQTVKEGTTTQKMSTDTTFYVNSAQMRGSWNPTASGLLSSGPLSAISSIRKGRCDNTWMETSGCCLSTCRSLNGLSSLTRPMPCSLTARHRSQLLFLG